MSGKSFYYLIADFVWWSFYFSNMRFSDNVREIWLWTCIYYYLVSSIDIFNANSKPGKSSYFNLNWFFLFLFLDLVDSKVYPDTWLVVSLTDIDSLLSDTTLTNDGKTLVSWISLKSTMLVGTLMSWNIDCYIFFNSRIYYCYFSYFSLSNLAYYSYLYIIYCFFFLYSSNYFSNYYNSL